MTSQTPPIYKPILFNPQPLKDKPSPLRIDPPQTTYQRYLNLATNIHRIKHSKAATPKTPLRICLNCGTLFRSTTRNTEYCSPRCFNHHRYNPTTPTTTSWCALGNFIINDLQHMKICCPDDDCHCQFNLIKPTKAIFKCIICHTYHRSLRNPLVCSQECAHAFNSIPAKERNKMLPTITHLLDNAHEEFHIFALIAQDTPNDRGYLKSLTLEINPLVLKDYAENNTLSTPTATISRYLGNCLLIQQNIYIGVEGNQVPPQSTAPYNSNPIVLHAIRKIHHETPPSNTCYHTNISSSNPNPRRQPYIIPSDPPFPLIYPLELQVIAYRLLFISQSISYLATAIPIATATLPRIHLKNPSQDLFHLNCAQLNKILTNITTLNDAPIPTSFNYPLYLTTKSALNHIPTALPSFNPESQSFEEFNDIPLCTDKQPLHNLTDVYTL